MSSPRTTQQKADAISLALMLIGFGVISYTDQWWPWILLVLGTSILIRQYLRGRPYDMAITVLVFGGIFVISYFKVNWSALLPVLLIVAGIFILFREFFVKKDRVGEDEVEEESQEVDDATKRNP